MLKFKLKRRISGRAIRKDIRRKKFTKEMTVYNIDGSPTIKLVPKYQYHNKWLYRKNNPEGKTYQTTIYQLEDQHFNQRGIHDKYRTNKVLYSEWEAVRMLKMTKNQSQRDRIYKLCPSINPKNIREKEHEAKVRQWQSKLKKKQS